MGLPDNGNQPHDEAVLVGELVEVLGRAHGFDLAAFSESFVARSFERRWQSCADMTPAGYVRLLRQDRTEAQAFLRSLDIHHSEFFRDPLAFAVLEQRLLPALAQAKRLSGQEIRVWSAGCAAGEEAYSLAILLRELSERGDGAVRFRIFATDSSAEHLDLAREGSYVDQSMGNVGLARLERWFRRQSNRYVIVPELREQVDFSVHDLLDDSSRYPRTSIFGEFDLVLCCNLLFYYRPQGHARILDKLRYSLANGAHLMTGEAEYEIMKTAGFEPHGMDVAIFRLSQMGR